MLAALVASPLDAGLALLVIVAVVILIAAAGAALEVRRAAGASLSLVCAVAVAGAGRACRALGGGSPAGDRGSVHAAPRGYGEVMGGQSEQRGKLRFRVALLGRYNCWW